jgi:hypothetical protein
MRKESLEYNHTVMMAWCLAKHRCIRWPNATLIYDKEYNDVIRC